MITTMDKIASTREGFIAGIMEAAAADPKVCLVFADSLKAARATPFGPDTHHGAAPRPPLA